MNKVIKISDKFPYPGPRFIKLGPQSGEAFKNYVYKQLIETYGENFDNNLGLVFTINLDGTIGYGSSFLEEGFGGLIRMGVPFNIINNIHLISNEEPELISEIKEYIKDEAEKNLNS